MVQPLLITYLLIKDYQVAGIIMDYISSYLPIFYNLVVKINKKRTFIYEKNN